MLAESLPRLVNPPCTLRAFEPRDAATIAAAADDPLIPLITSVPANGSPIEVEAYIQRQHDRLESGQGYSFAIADADTDEAVGQIGLWTHDIDAGRASIGYWIASDFRRRGYARAALQTLTAWALQRDDLERVQLFVEPWNEGSWRAAERCGFEREGLLRSWQKVGLEPKDMYVYSVVRADRRSH